MRTMKLVTIGAALVGMGISMPSCPGQQAMQQQLEGLQTKLVEQVHLTQALDTQLKTSSADLIQVKTLLEQVSNAVLAQKQSLEQMDIALKTAQQQLVDLDNAVKNPPRSSAKKRK